MEKDRLDDFRKKKETIKHRKNTIAEIVNLKRENIELEAKTIGVLKECKNNYSFLSSMMDDVPESQIVKMSEEDYLTLTSGIEDPIISGEVAVEVWNQSKQSKGYSQQHYDMCASLNTLCVSGTSNYMGVSNAYAAWFPNKNRITEEYKVKDDLFNQIAYIGEYLRRNLPEVAADYKAFIAKYNAFKNDSSQYQDLIGGSMFFWKMIFDFSFQNYGVDTPRIAAIEIFVFGTADPVPTAKHIIKSCNDLYERFSTQDDNVPSIKTGNVTPVYVESMFRRLIGNMATLLQLRGKYFRA
jgi:hypothetical protein